MRRLVLLPLSLALCGPAGAADRATIIAARDATLVQEPDGLLANGSGPALFAGRTGQARDGIRRALLYFDLAGTVPRNAVIESASLTLYLTPSNEGPRRIRVHRVLADWGEGPSASSGGGGAPAEPGDATWLHTFFDTEFWRVAGGQFAGHASAELEVDGDGFYNWDERALAIDVRSWAATPSRNFGWVLVGDESERRTSKRFASRENPDTAWRPVLAVEYRRPNRP